MQNAISEHLLAFIATVAAVVAARLAIRAFAGNVVLSAVSLGGRGGFWLKFGNVIVPGVAGGIVAAAGAALWAEASVVAAATIIAACLSYKVLQQRDY